MEWSRTKDIILFGSIWVPDMRGVSALPRDLMLFCPGAEGANWELELENSNCPIYRN